MTPPSAVGLFYEPLHGLGLSLNEAITSWVVWWWCGVSNTKTCKIGTEFFAIKGGTIVAHDLIGNAFYTEQLF